MFGHQMIYDALASFETLHVRYTRMARARVDSPHFVPCTFFKSG